jgi:hypothetical protein
VPRPPRELLEPGYIALESSHDLADAVATRSGLNVVPIPELYTGEDKAPIAVQALPISLLGALGTATAGPPTVGRSLLRMSGHWATARYAWAFDMPGPIATLGIHPRLLRLSDPTDDVRYHRRALMSEDFGMAVASRLIRDVLRGGGTRPVALEADTIIDRLLHAGHIVRRHARSGRRSQQPDLFFGGRPAGKPVLAVVECKGSSDGRATMVDQLAAGAHQALSVAGRAIPTRHFVVGAVVTRTRRTPEVHAVEVTTEDAAVADDGDADATLEELRRLTRLDLLRFAGVRADTPDGPAVNELAPGVTAIGVEHELLLEDGEKLVLFTGLEREHASAYRDNREVDSTTAQRLGAFVRERGGLAILELEALESAARDERRAEGSPAQRAQEEWLAELRKSYAPAFVAPVMPSHDPEAEDTVASVALDGVVIALRAASLG